MSCSLCSIRVKSMEDENLRWCLRNLNDPFLFPLIHDVNNDPVADVAITLLNMFS